MYSPIPAESADVDSEDTFTSSDVTVVEVWTAGSSVGVGEMTVPEGEVWQPIIKITIRENRVIKIFLFFSILIILLILPTNAWFCQTMKQPEIGLQVKKKALQYWL